MDTKGKGEVKEGGGGRGLKPKGKGEKLQKNFFSRSASLDLQSFF